MASSVLTLKAVKHPCATVQHEFQTLLKWSVFLAKNVPLKHRGIHLYSAPTIFARACTKLIVRPMLGSSDNNPRDTHQHAHSLLIP